MFSKIYLVLLIHIIVIQYPEQKLMLSKLISANTCWKDEKYLYFRISSIKKKKKGKKTQLVKVIGNVRLPHSIMRRQGTPDIWSGVGSVSRRFYTHFLVCVLNLSSDCFPRSRKKMHIEFSNFMPSRRQSIYSYNFLPKFLAFMDQNNSRYNFLAGEFPCSEGFRLGQIHKSLGSQDDISLVVTTRSYSCSWDAVNMYPSAWQPYNVVEGCNKIKIHRRIAHQIKKNPKETSLAGMELLLALV